MTASAQVALERIEVVADGLDHPEGVAVGADGTLYAGGEAGQLYRIDQVTGAVEQIACSGGWILGLALDRDDTIVACDPKRRELLAVTPEGEISVLSSGTPERPMTNPNWPVFSDDALYVSDSGTWDGAEGRIYRVQGDGRTELWCEDLPHFTNGMALNGAGDALFVVESTGPRVSRVPILADGSAGEPELVVELPGTVPDGLAFDEEGALYVACYRPDRIYRLDRHGRLEIVAEDYQGTVVGAPTNVALGGRDGRDLFIASLARWHVGRMRVPVPGLPLRYPSLRSIGGRT